LQARDPSVGTNVMSDDASTVTFPVVRGEAESVFGIREISPVSPKMTVTAGTRRWGDGMEGDAPAGTLGVLADNASGYAVISGAPAGHWSVTTELTLELFGRIPTDGQELIASATLVDRQGDTGYSEGPIVDAEGRIVARMRQRGRYVLGSPDPDTTVAQSEPRPPASSLCELFGRTFDLTTDPTLVPEPMCFDVTPGMVNPLGTLHGGIGLCLVDWMASEAFRGTSGDPLRTTAVHAVYLRPAPLGSRITVETTVTHRGRTLGLAHVIVARPDGKPIISATVTAGSESDA
jgi:uncharacterized protein (TIGR00369 family)